MYTKDGMSTGDTFRTIGGTWDWEGEPIPVGSRGRIIDRTFDYTIAGFGYVAVAIPGHGDTMVSVRAISPIGNEVHHVGFIGRRGGDFGTHQTARR